MKRLNRAAGLAAMLGVVAAAACATSSVFRQPEVALAGARIGGVGLKGGLIYVQLHVDNPNSYALRAGHLAYDFDLKDTSAATETWVKLAQGDMTQDIKVPGHGSANIEIPIEFNYIGAGGAIKSVLDRGTMSYRVNGAVGVNEPIRRDIPFRKTGVVSLAGVR